MATRSSKGRVIQPKHIRNAHKWSPEAEFMVEDTPEGILLRPLKRFEPTRLKDAIGGTGYTCSAKPIKEMDGGIARGIEASLRDPKRRPTQSGEMLRADVLPALDMTQTEFARRLSVSRLSVSELLLKKRGLSPDMALRIGRRTNTTPESWLRMQEAVDLWELEQYPKRYLHIEPIAA